MHVLKMLRVLLKEGVLPGVLAQNYFVYLIYLINKEDEKGETGLAAVEYAKELVVNTRGEFFFLKMWKKKVLSDRYYKDGKLNSFVAGLGDTPQYRVFVYNKMASNNCCYTILYWRDCWLLVVHL